MKEFAKIIGMFLPGVLGLVAITAVVVLPVVLPVVAVDYVFSSSACNKRAKMMGLQYEYGFIAGCMVKVGDRYAPMSYIRIVDNKVMIQGDGEE